MARVANSKLETQPAQSLLRTLVEKGVFSNSEARAVLTKAAAALGPHDYTAPIKGAIGIILDDVLPKFPENGGD
ncbi:MAG TPA: hypothetical protein VFN63_07570 [Pseudolabrys sp.]|jgi:hypothetical protein|nr:hypothetical protein [Pseudolabrys sp.]